MLYIQFIISFNIYKWNITYNLFSNVILRHSSKHRKLDKIFTNRKNQGSTKESRMRCSKMIRLTMLVIRCCFKTDMNVTCQQCCVEILRELGLRIFEQQFVNIIHNIKRNNIIDRIIPLAKECQVSYVIDIIMKTGETHSYPLNDNYIFAHPYKINTLREIFQKYSNGSTFRVSYQTDIPDAISNIIMLSDSSDSFFHRITSGDATFVVSENYYDNKISLSSLPQGDCISAFANSSSQYSYSFSEEMNLELSQNDVLGSSKDCINGTITPFILNSSASF